MLATAKNNFVIKIITFNTFIYRMFREGLFSLKFHFVMFNFFTNFSSVFSTFSQVKTVFIRMGFVC